MDERYRVNIDQMNGNKVYIQHVIDAIRAGKEYRKSRDHLHVCIRGKYYFVIHWFTIIAVGRLREPPFLCRTCGYNTVTTLNVLHCLGFALKSKRIPIGKKINPDTNRKCNIYDRVMHINGRPMFKPGTTETDYDGWYTINGFNVGHCEPSI